MAAADATKKLRVGSTVFGNDFRHPVVLAREGAARCFQARLILASADDPGREQDHNIPLHWMLSPGRVSRRMSDKKRQAAKAMVTYTGISILRDFNFV
jgi:alkanesulfonate monooxygenase SsuD/methylene tetrahydromethanopterin reductase-like flavin-dependent oxidoreductase (luciferase family)